MNRIGAFFNKLIHDKKISFEDLATSCRITDYELDQIISGNYKPTKTEAMMLWNGFIDILIERAREDEKEEIYNTIKALGVFFDFMIGNDPKMFEVQHNGDIFNPD